MRPKKPKTTEEGDLFRARLDQIINMKHELVQVAFKIDWDWIDREIAPLYSDTGRPGIETRFVIGLLLLKHIYGLSTKGCASAGSMIRISSTSPARRFSSTSSRMSVRISAIGGSASVTSWSFCWPRV
jgi:hypothetical protein